MSYIKTRPLLQDKLYDMGSVRGTGVGRAEWMFPRVTPHNSMQDTSLVTIFFASIKKSHWVYYIINMN